MGQSQSKAPQEQSRTLSVPNPKLDTSDLPDQILSQKQTSEGADDQPDDYAYEKAQIEIEIRQKINEECKSRMIEGLVKAVEDTERKFVKYSGPRSPFANELQQQVHQCYHENLRHPLNCSKIVREFTETVERERRNAAFSRQS